MVKCLIFVVRDSSGEEVDRINIAGRGETLTACKRDAKQQARKFLAGFTVKELD